MIDNFQLRCILFSVTGSLQENDENVIFNLGVNYFSVQICCHGFLECTLSVSFAYKKKLSAI